MYMKNRLPGISPVVDDQTVSRLVKPMRSGNCLSDEEEVPNELSIPFCHALYVRDMFRGHN